MSLINVCFLCTAIPVTFPGSRKEISVACSCRKTFFKAWNILGHGGEGELPIAPALFPPLCQPEHARGVVPYLPPYPDVRWLFPEITTTGASGDPAKASREKGLFMKEALVNAIVTALQKPDACGGDYRSAEVKREGMPAKRE